LLCLIVTHLVIFLFTDLILSHEEKELYALQEIYHILRRNSTLLTYYKTMPQVPRDPRFDTNVLILDEKGYDCYNLTENMLNGLRCLHQSRSLFTKILLVL